MGVVKSFQHPLYEDRVVYVLEGNHVTLDAGTGCVHTAPGHGVDDFEVYKSYENAGKLKQEILCPVDEKGRMTEEAGLGLVGKTIWEAEGPVISLAGSCWQTSGQEVHSSSVCTLLALQEPDYLPRNRTVVCIPSMISETRL